MSRRNKIFLIVAAAILVVILLLALLTRDKEEAVVIPEAGVGTPVPENILLPDRAVGVGAEIVQPADIEEQQQINNLIKISSAFAERFGSYSNQSNFQNIRDLQIFMTDSMKRWSENYINSFTARDNSIYYGVTTKALNAQLIKYSEDKEAEILVKTQRRESVGNTANSTISYQDISIKLKKERGDIWKVDGAFWE